MQSSTEATKKAAQMREYDDVPSIQRISLSRKDACVYMNTQVVEAVFREYERGNVGYRCGVRSA